MLVGSTGRPPAGVFAVTIRSALRSTIHRWERGSVLTGDITESRDTYKDAMNKAGLVNQLIAGHQLALLLATVTLIRVLLSRRAVHTLG